jgi:hypothetical protein
MILAIIESNWGGMRRPAPRRCRPARRAAGQHEVLDHAGGGGEVVLGVLGRQPGLDGVAVRRGRGRGDVGQPAAHRHVQLELDDVDARRRLGDRVLDLQARVDLQERQQLVARLVEELDGAGVDVARRADQPSADARSSSSCSASSAREADSSITFWLRRCTLQSRTPSVQTSPWRRRRPAPRRAARRARALEEDGGVARRPGAFGRGAGERLGSSSGRLTSRIPRPPPPAWP